MRSIHNLESSYFRTKFEPTLNKFIKSIAGKWLSNGKIRIGWGQTGNANIGAYKWGTTVTKFLVGQTYRPKSLAAASTHGVSACGCVRSRAEAQSRFQACSDLPPLLA